MGDYTELVLGVRFKEDTPAMVIGILKSLVNDYANEYAIAIDSDHTFFTCDRWQQLLLSSSYYFDGLSQSKIHYDPLVKAWFLTSRSNLKNYNNEIEHFLDWIAPYVETRHLAGYIRFEYSLCPSLIYFKDTGVDIVAVDDGILYV